MCTSYQHCPVPYEPTRPLVELQSSEIKWAMYKKLYTQGFIMTIPSCLIHIFIYFSHHYLLSGWLLDLTSKLKYRQLYPCSLHPCV